MNNSAEPDFERLGTPYAILLISINVCTSLVACILNLLIILTFVKSPSMRTPSFFLILCLAIADFGVGSLVQPVYCIELFARMNEARELLSYAASFRLGSTWVLVASSFLTITAITIDRFLAIHLNLRYQEIVTTKRSCIVVVVIFIVSPFGIFAGLRGRFPVVKIIFASLIVILLLLNIFLMAKIFQNVSKHSANIRAQGKSVALQGSLSLSRYKKTVNTMYYIIGVFGVCYIPVASINIALNISKLKLPFPIAFYLVHVPITLMLINSALNPVIYCWRIQDMRNAVLHLFRKP
ncbi:melanocyte-stimulating hormone receptor-like [Exaiptasia diaphana]|uniref:G-protein coupled receptors family 1 profile domain-containing protein n=1 Tax=Exaiptasia diaphana TaxID=2652724 RepID=A0A913XQ50_EXADI|nr:melanocyte-stimulating hormone receptor-like [Exaiptasia diaphana]